MQTPNTHGPVMENGWFKIEVTEGQFEGVPEGWLWADVEWEYPEPDVGIFHPGATILSLVDINNVDQRRNIEDQDEAWLLSLADSIANTYHPSNWVED